MRQPGTVSRSGIKPPGGKIRVIIASDVPIARAALRALLSTQLALEVVAETDLRDVVAACRGPRPTVVVIHAVGDHSLGLKATQALRRETEPAAVVVLTYTHEEAYVRSYLMAGASGYVLANGHPRDLLTAIRLAADGRTFLDPMLSDSIVHMLVRRPVAVRDSKGVESMLSEREQQVLRFIALGYTHQEIANALSVSAKTVDTYRTRIAEKTNLRTRAEIVRYAMALGLMDSGAE